MHHNMIVYLTVLLYVITLTKALNLPLVEEYINTISSVQLSIGIRDTQNQQVPDWLANNLSKRKKSKDVIKSEIAYLDNLYRTCSFSLDSLEICRLVCNAEIDRALIFGSLFYVWIPSFGKEITNQISDSIILPQSFAALNAEDMLKKAYTEIWLEIQEQLARYDARVPEIPNFDWLVREVSLQHLQHHKQQRQQFRPENSSGAETREDEEDTDSLYSSESHHHNRFPVSVSSVMHSYYAPQAQSDSTFFLQKWWSIQPMLLSFTQKALSAYSSWSKDYAGWSSFADPFLRVSKDRDLDKSLQTKTIEIAQKIHLTKYFNSPQNMIFEPYYWRIPSILESASPAKAVRQFCESFDCSRKLKADLFSVDYLTHPNVMLELAYILTEENRKDNAQELAELVDENNDLFRYTTKLSQACIAGEIENSFCDISGFYHPSIYFFISQASILRDEYEQFKLLWDIREPSNGFDVYEFNNYLIRLYQDISKFFALSQDSMLEFWALKDWTKGGITDLYLYYRGENDMLNALQAQFDLYTPDPMMINSFPIETYKLPDFWHKFFSTLENNRIIWWKELYLLCSKLDKWREKNIDSYTPFLLDYCKNENMINCIKKLTKETQNLHNKIDKGGRSLNINKNLQHRLLLTNGETTGDLQAIQDTLQTIMTKSTLKAMFTKKLRIDKRQIPASLLPPSAEDILRNTRGFDISLFKQHQQRQQSDRSGIRQSVLHELYPPRQEGTSFLDFGPKSTKETAESENQLYRLRSRINESKVNLGRHKKTNQSQLSLNMGSNTETSLAVRLKKSMNFRKQ